MDASCLHRFRQRGWGRIESFILVIGVAGLAWLFLWPGDTFSQVKIGMSRSEAISTVGTPPRKEDKALTFCREGATPTAIARRSGNPAQSISCCGKWESDRGWSSAWMPTTRSAIAGG